MSEPLIRASGLERVYGSGSTQVFALRGVDMELHSGGFIALKGRSGSGKTTLLNCLSGLDKPTAGTIEYEGRNLATMNERELTDWRRKSVGFIFQSFGLIPTLSAYENVDLMLRIAGMHGSRRHARTMEVLGTLGLAKWAHHRPYELSGGQQQRVAIARALVTKPSMMLADEPTGELDSTTSRDILGLFRKIVDEEGLTLLMSSHDPLVDGYADRILTMRDGQIVP